MSFDRESYPKSKKIHNCEWCMKDIKKGTVYYYRAGTSDGDLFTEIMHVECSKELKQELIDHMDDYGYCLNDGYTIDNLRESFKERKADALEEN